MKSFTASGFIAEAVSLFSEGEFIAIVGDEDSDVESLATATKSVLETSGKTTEVFDETQDFTYLRVDRVNVLERRLPPNDFTGKDDERDGITNVDELINLEIVHKRAISVPYIALVTGERTLNKSIREHQGLIVAVEQQLVDINPHTLFRLYDRLYFFEDDTTVYEIKFRI